jgi:hypothetical protein
MYDYLHRPSHRTRPARRANRPGQTRRLTIVRLARPAHRKRDTSRSGCPVSANRLPKRC